MRLYSKIDLFYNGDYLCTTSQSKTCKQAVSQYLERITMRSFYNGLLDRQILKNSHLLKARKQK